MTMDKSSAGNPAPTGAALYVGKVMHARLKPVQHRFQYRVFSLLIDLDKLEQVNKLSAIFSIGAFNLFSFHPTDHGNKKSDNLRAYVNGLFSAHKLSPPQNVFLLCYPRILGFVFNPLSVYFCYDADFRISALIYEVRNTFGQRHTYFAPVKAGELSNSDVRQERDKLFYVSPFMDMDLRYKFHIRQPQKDVLLRIMEHDATGPMLSAIFHGERRPFSTRMLTDLFFRLPLHNFKIISGIHWEALRLWLKGMRLRPRPAAPLRVSTDGLQKIIPDIISKH